MIIFLGILFLILFFYCLSVKIVTNNGVLFKKISTNSVFILITLVAFLVRCFVAVLLYGFSGDIYCFKMWADELYKYGFNNYYSLGFSSHDYVPGYLYILYFVGLIKNVFSLSYYSLDFLFFIKLPAIIFDMLSAIFIYKLAKNYFSKKTSLIFYGLYLFNFAIITNSAFWGQVDSIHTFFMVLSLYYIFKDRLFLTGLFFTISVIFKFQSIFILPVVLFYLVKKTILTKEYIRNIGILLSMFGIFYIVSLPFSINQILSGDVLFPFKIYLFQLNNYSYFTLNAFNLYGVLGLNFVPISISSIFSYLSILLVFAISIFLCFKQKDAKSVFVIASYLVLAIFTLSFKMHERYLYPLLILLLISSIVNKDKELLKFYILFSALHFLNTFLLLVNSDYTFGYGRSGVVSVFSLLNMILFFAFLLKTKKIVVFNQTSSIFSKKYVNERGKKLNTVQDFLAKKRLLNKNKNSSFEKLDYIFIIFLTAFTLFITLFNLGSRNVPESYYKSQSVDDYAVIKLEDKDSLEKIYVYYGIMQREENAFEIFSLTSEEEKLTQENLILVPDFLNSNMYSWQQLVVKGKAKGDYLAFKLCSENSYLLEIVLTDKDNKKIDFEIIKCTNESFLYAFDETDKFPKFSSFKNGYTKNLATDMYFDEIYHARTAFEHLNGLTPYEISHPPLGKILMSVSIKIFGMNPFAYRILGAVLSSLSVCVLYFIVKRLFNKSLIAYVGALLYSLDGIRLSMGRIATLEGMTGFFVLLSYLFMLIFIQNNMFKVKVSKVYVPLILSGVFFSVSACIKWTGIYAGVGLLILFVYYIVKRTQEYFYYKKSEKALDCKEISVYNKKIGKYKQNILGIVLTAFLSFIVLYLVLYIICYLPYKVQGEERSLLRIFLENQKFMLSYHSGVTETHPSQSYWYSFLLGTNSVFMFLGDDNYGGNIYSRVHAISNLSLNIVCLLALIFTSVYIYKNRKDKKRFSSNEYIKNIQVLTFIFVGFLCNYLPWAFIDRPIFLYHFYNSMPFYICFVCFVMNEMLNKKEFTLKGITKVKSYNKIYFIVIIVAINFILFYPLFTGLPISNNLANYMFRWVLVLGRGYGI